jgi:hypothetical protein
MENGNTMLELKKNTLVFSFPKVHPEAKLTIDFQRTLRIPDDGKTYPLPPGLGSFPLKHVDDFKGKVPALWQEHGGVFTALYQSEALWINFRKDRKYDRKGEPAAYPFIVKVGTGKKSALTGKEWQKGIHNGDYCVIPDQPWLDGYVIETGTIAQFVAVPLGMGLTVEEQLGGSGIGGIQIEVFPMRGEEYEKRYPKRPFTPQVRRIFLGGGIETKGAISYGSGSDSWEGSSGATIDCCAAAGDSCMRGLRLEERNEISEMGIGAGGRMKQQVFEDAYGKDVWSRNVDKSRKCFVHLANSMAWETITGEKPPATPVTAAAYEQHHYPWFDYYSDALQAKKGSALLANVKTVKEAAAEKGLKGIIPENTSVEPKHILKVKSSEVLGGKW